MCGKQPNLSTYICRQLNKNRGEKNKVDTTFSSVAHSCPTPCDPMDCSTWASLSITNSWSLLKLMSTESVMPSNHVILCRPLLLPPSIFSSVDILIYNMDHSWDYQRLFKVKIPATGCNLLGTYFSRAGQNLLLLIDKSFIHEGNEHLRASLVA